MTQRIANLYVVSEFYRSWRLDRYLQAMIPKLSRARIQSAIRTRIELSWHPKPRPSLAVQPGGEVRIYFPRIVEPEIGEPPGILYEDTSLLVADKPPRLLVHPTHSCQENNLIHLLRRERPGVPLALAHRLDRDTSGVIVMTKSTDAARALARQFEAREVFKEYLAVVAGRIRRKEGTIDAPLGVSRSLQVIFRRSTEGHDAKTAVTDFRVLGVGRTATLVLLHPRTGRRHQLRAHLAALGHPIVGDRLYTLSDREFLKHLRGSLPPETGMRPGVDRQLLHASRLTLRHPRTGEPATFRAPVPNDFTELLADEGIGPPEPTA